jgi:hypothetical protein
VERGVDRAVDDAGLEAGIRVAKGYRRGHGTVAVVDYASAVMSAAKRQLDLSLAGLGQLAEGSRPAPTMSLIVDLLAPPQLRKHTD